MMHKSKESMLYKEIEKYSFKEKFKIFLDLIEMVEIRDKGLAEQHKKYSCDNARFKGQQNQANYFRDIGKAIYDGKPWAMEIYHKILKEIGRSK